MPNVISDLKRMDLITKEQIRSFQAEVSSFVASIVNKIFVRSPLESVVVKNVNAWSKNDVTRKCQ